MTYYDLFTKWYEPSDRLPNCKNIHGEPIQPDGNSEVVLVWVGVNNVTYKQCTLAHYDYKNNKWIFSENKYDGYLVKLWCELPNKSEFEYQGIDFFNESD